MQRDVDISGIRRELKRIADALEKLVAERPEPGAVRFEGTWPLRPEGERSP